MWGANDFGGTLINESISTSAGAQHGQLLKPKEIRRMVREINRTPAQRSTDYQILRTFENENEYEDELDTVDPKRFGSYFELIKIDKYKYKNPRRS
jgi:FO synthase subunit 2